MRKFAMIFAAAAGLLLSACVEEKLVEPQDQRPDISGEPVTITVGVPENKPSTRVALGGEKGLEMTWDEGDQLYALGFDAQDTYLGLAEFTIQSDCAGTKSARFDGMTVKGADHYVIYYKASGLTVSKDGKVSMDYSNMTSDGRNSSLPLKGCLYLKSEPVLAADLKTAVFTLKALNSVLCLEFQGYPSNLGELNAVDWAIVDKSGAERKVMRLHYTGKTTLLGARPALNGLYLCFNPEEVKLEAGEQFRFRLNGTAGRNFSFLSAPKAGVVFGVGKRYSALVKAYNEPFADLLDIVFDDDKGARDLSPWGRGINTDKGTAIKLVRPEGYAANAVTFSHKFAGAPSGGVYTVPDYDMRDAMADGFSIEAYVMSDDPARTNGESKAFSSTKSGGFALELKNQRLHFIYKPSNASWRFLDSGIEATLGQWYHVVGVFDPVNGSSLYVDGKQVVKPVYAGDKLTFSSLNEASYLTVGANSSGGTAKKPALQGAWHGGVTQPRIYSKPLSEGEVQALFKQLGNIKPSPVESQHNAPEADMLDVVFNADGSAVDVSASKMTVEHLAGEAHVNYYNKMFDRQVAHFNHVPGSMVSRGFYKIDYENNEDFISKLKDGHSIEILFSTDQKLTGQTEVKMFSSTENGGLGFLMSKSDNGNCLTYLPNVSSDASSKWIWTTSGVNPEPGQYVHAVGVWDKAAGKARIYVDGKMLKETAAEGELNLPSAGNRWFAIGSDPSAKTGGQSSWCGDVVLARIYDQPLSDFQVSSLYQRVKGSQTGKQEFISLSNIKYQPSCKVEPGYKYHIFANGFKQNDRFFLDPQTAGENSIWPEIVVKEGELFFTVPSSLKNGKYRMVLQRGKAQFQIGLAEFTIGAPELKPVDTKVIAHRCYHKTHAENTVAAFVDTENKGIWGAEIDAHITTDGKVLIHHNGDYKNSLGGKEYFDEHSYAEITKALNVNSVPELEDFLTAMTDKRVPNVNLVLELKPQKGNSAANNPRLVDKCFEIINRLSASHPELKSRIAWISFDAGMCKRVADKIKADSQWKNPMVMLLGEAMYNSDQSQFSPELIAGMGLDGMDYSKDFLRANPTLITRAKKAGLAVNVWTVNNSSDMIYFLDQEVEYITTDETALLNELLKLQFITR